MEDHERSMIRKTSLAGWQTEDIWRTPRSCCCPSLLLSDTFWRSGRYAVWRRTSVGQSSSIQGTNVVNGNNLRLAVRKLISWLVCWRSRPNGRVIWQIQSIFQTRLKLVNIFNVGDQQANRNDFSPIVVIDGIAISRKALYRSIIDYFSGLPFLNLMAVSVSSKEALRYFL